MAAYNTPAPLYKQASPGHGMGGNLKVAFTEITLSAAVTTADTIDFFELPASARVISATLEASDIDTGGAPAVTINVGDGDSATRFFSGSTVGQAGTASVATAATGIFHKYTAKTKIVGAIAVDPQTGAAGTLRLAMLYTID